MSEQKPLKRLQTYTMDGQEVEICEYALSLKFSISCGYLPLWKPAMMELRSPYLPRLAVLIDQSLGNKR